MTYVFQFIMAALTTMAFCFYFNAPKKTVVKISAIGGIGWMVYYIIGMNAKNPLLSTLLASLAIGICAEYTARASRIPATTVIYPAITPLVPGAHVYYAMNAVIAENSAEVAYQAGEAFIKAAGLSLGITVSIVISKIIFNKMIKVK